jgi:probable rRNA maturation factor
MSLIQIADSLNASPPELLADVSYLERAALETLRQAGASPEAGFSVVITDDEQLHQLNRQFLEIDAPTDVLSFPSDEIDPDTGEPYLGDVLISLPRAVAQAQAGGHATRDELQLLVVHGVLHLLGHDHAGPDEKARMWAIQASVLEGLGCHVVWTTE